MARGAGRGGGLRRQKARFRRPGLQKDSFADLPEKR